MIWHPWGPSVSAIIERLRTTFRWKVDGLDSAGLASRLPASALTLGGLLKHLARADAQCFTTKLRGASLGAPWDSVDWRRHPDWDFESAADDSPSDLYALWDTTVAASRASLAPPSRTAASTSWCT